MPTCEFLPNRQCQLAKWVGKVQEFIQQRKKEYLDCVINWSVLQKTNDTVMSLMEYLQEAEAEDITASREELSLVKLGCKNDSFQVLIFVDMSEF